MSTHISVQGYWKIIAIALISISMAMFGATLPTSSAHATTSDNQSAALTADLLANGIDSATMNAALDELLTSDLSRTVTESRTDTRYVFHLPLASAENGVFDFTVVAPKADAPTPRIGVGSDARGPYYLLNNFDQNLLISGGATIIAAALCAIPGVGWISCAVITTAVIVGGTFVSTYGVCSGGRQLKGYFFAQGNRFSCVYA